MQSNRQQNGQGPESWMKMRIHPSSIQLNNKEKKQILILTAVISIINCPTPDSQQAYSEKRDKIPRVEAICATKRIHSYPGPVKICVLCSVAQLCPTLCNPMDCSPPGSSVHRDSPGKNTGVGCHALLQGIFPTQGSNPSLPYCRQILYHLSYKWYSSGN